MDNDVKLAKREGKKKARKAGKKGAGKGEGKAVAALARAIWIEQSGRKAATASESSETNGAADATEQKEKGAKRGAEWKALAKDQRKAVLLLARRVLRRLERAGLAVAAKA